MADELTPLKRILAEYRANATATLSVAEVSEEESQRRRGCAENFLKVNANILKANMQDAEVGYFFRDFFSRKPARALLWLEVLGSFPAGINLFNFVEGMVIVAGNAGTPVETGLEFYDTLAAALVYISAQDANTMMNFLGRFFRLHSYTGHEQDLQVIFRPLAAEIAAYGLGQMAPEQREDFLKRLATNIRQIIEPLMLKYANGDQDFKANIARLVDNSFWRHQAEQSQTSGADSAIAGIIAEYAAGSASPARTEHAPTFLAAAANARQAYALRHHLLPDGADGAGEPATGRPASFKF